MEFLRFLEGLRNPVCDVLFTWCTLLGEETLFLLVAMSIFWCVNKKWGYYIFYMSAWGLTTNQLLKNLFCVPRPWALDPGFTIVESARAAATGYSFPSGHTANAVTLYGGLAARVSKSWPRWALIGAAALVGLSRMYLGVHTPTDVLTSAAISVILILACKPLLDGADHNEKLRLWLYVAMVGWSIVTAIVLTLIPLPEGANAELSLEGVKNSYTLCGVTLGLFVARYVDDRWLHFETKAAWPVQILKVALGFLVVVGVQTGLKTPVNALFGGALIANTVRYFLVIAVGCALWPATFRYFAGLHTKAN